MAQAWARAARSLPSSWCALLPAVRSALAWWRAMRCQPPQAAEQQAVCHMHQHPDRPDSCCLSHLSSCRLPPPQLTGPLVQDHWCKNNRRIVWVSVSADLKFDAVRDLEDVGAGHIPVLPKVLSLERMHLCGSRDLRSASAASPALSACTLRPWCCMQHADATGQGSRVQRVRRATRPSPGTRSRASSRASPSSPTPCSARAPSTGPTRWAGRPRWRRTRPTAMWQTRTPWLRQLLPPSWTTSATLPALHGWPRLQLQTPQACCDLAPCPAAPARAF